MFKRIYKVSYDMFGHATKTQERHTVPCLRFSGMWLKEKVGLKVGDKVQVYAEQGKIAILKISTTRGEHAE